MTPAAQNSRRFFMRSAAAATATTAAAPIAAAEPRPSRADRRTIATDVLVCGGGCAGTAAALAAARSGARTLLVERAGFSGGIITAVGLPYFDGLIDKPTGRFVVKGLALDFLTELGVAKPGATCIDDCRPDLITKYWGSVLIPNTEAFKLLTDGRIKKQGDLLGVLYHSMACDVDVRGGRIAAVAVANKDGLVRIEAKQVVDCTGDADIAYWAGCPTEKMDPLMPMTMHFRIGNVAPAKETQAAAKAVLVDAHRAGKLPEFYGPGLIFAFAKDEAYIHATRINGDATDAADLSRAEMQGRADAWTIFKEWQGRVPGFENAYFISSGPYIGIRESRRIVAERMLTLDDLEKTSRYDDAVATGCWFLDVHPQKTSTDKPFAGSGFQPKPYDISYRTLVAKGVANLLVAGRCHGATKEAAASSRVTVTAMAMGEAAGTAAALAVQANSDVAAFDGVVVRETLARHGGGPFTDG